ncbi:MAG: 2Fe-2S iron-sulfur cluster-binding protein [Pseudomonadota bacterium]
MAHFYPLRVASIEKETDQAVILTLLPEESEREKFRFIQGQYLTFKKEIEGEEIRRSYSICAAPTDGHLSIGVKKVDGGCFSTWIHEELQEGDSLCAMPPMGNFHIPINSSESRHYLLIAAGSGITPIISIIRTILTSEPNSSISLIYGNRSASTIMFREELDDLKNTHMERLSILHVLSTERDLDLFAGRIDKEKCDILFDGWINVGDIDYAFICGPEEMMRSASAVLAQKGLPKKQIKFELFGTPQQGIVARKAFGRLERDTKKKRRISITADGVTKQIDTIDSDKSLLELAVDAGLAAPFSCKAGVCSTCKAKVVEGKVDMQANYALEDYEVERGYVLCCQSFAKSDELVVDFDQ